MMASGTDWRLKERLKIAIEPTDMSEAMAVKIKVTIWCMPMVSVRGIEIVKTSRTLGHQILNVNLGAKPKARTVGHWIAKCRNAPSTTPKASPDKPKAG